MSVQEVPSNTDQNLCPEMEPQIVCIEKRLSGTDVNRNLEVPSQARFLPEGNGIMLVTDRDGITYEFIASVRKSGRRSLTLQWSGFAAAKGLRAGEFVRINWSGNENHYVVQVGLEAHGRHIIWETL